MPRKMYNINVSSAILLSFLKATCIKEIDEYCKQKNIQLSIELDAIRRLEQHKGGTASTSASVADSRPTSVASNASAALDDPARPASNSSRRSSNVGMEVQSEEPLAVRAKRGALEKQLDVVNNAAKLVKDLADGICWLDIADQNGTRLHLDNAENNFVNTLATARQEYRAIAVRKNDKGEPIITPLLFKLVS